jgi:hypothetical protein
VISYISKCAVPIYLPYACHMHVLLPLPARAKFCVFMADDGRPAGLVAQLVSACTSRKNPRAKGPPKSKPVTRVVGGRARGQKRTGLRFVFGGGSGI